VILTLGRLGIPPQTPPFFRKEGNFGFARRDWKDRARGAKKLTLARAPRVRYLLQDITHTEHTLKFGAATRAVVISNLISRSMSVVL